MAVPTFIFLTHTQLVNIFRKGYCYSMDDKAKFEQGIDTYIVPSVIKDMQFRVRGMGVKKQNAKSLEEIKKDFSIYLKTEFWSYFKNGQSFSDFHNKACNDMIDIFSKRYNNVSYGKAQKAINMTFKYFYCFENADSSQNEPKFSDCHMPLDSKILEWYRKEIDNNQHTAWSYLYKNEYDIIQENIKKHIDQKYNGNYTVLQAEFVIWEDAINKKAGTKKMFTKNEFIKVLNRSLELAQDAMEDKDKNRTNLHIANVETIDFNIEETMKEWASENNVNYSVVDISTLTLDDVSAIPEILSTPTVLLLKNFGDYTHDMLREPYRQLVKDCCYGTDGIFANNFLFAVATTKSDMPIRDMSERCCFGLFNN